MAGWAGILNRKTILAAFAFRLPAARTAAVNHGVGVEGRPSARGIRENARIQPLQDSHNGIVASPKRGVKPFHFVSIAVQRGGSVDLAIFKVHLEHKRSRETDPHDLFEEYGEDLFGTFSGEQAQCRGVPTPLLHEQDRFLQYARAGHRSHSFNPPVLTPGSPARWGTRHTPSWFDGHFRLRAWTKLWPRN